MSTILARRLKASRAKPVLVRADTSELDTADLRIAALSSKDMETDTWSSLDYDYDSSSASSSSSSSNGSSIFFEEMDDLSLPDASARSSHSTTFQEEHEAASIIQCLACDESDNAVEESWQEHVYHREVTPSRSHRESSRRSKTSSSSSSSSSASMSKARRHTPPSATVCPPTSYRPSARSSRRKQVPSSSPPSSSSSSDDDDAQYKLRSSSRLRRSKRLSECECDPLACPPSPHPQAVELCPIVQARLRTTVNPSFYLIYTLENVMMRERKIRYPLKDRATHLSFGTSRGSLALSPLRRCELA